MGLYYLCGNFSDNLSFVLFTVLNSADHQTILTNVFLKPCIIITFLDHTPIRSPLICIVSKLHL